MFPAYQSGREFDDDLIEQLNVLPELVAAFGFANAKAPGYEADDFLAAAVAFEERAGSEALVAGGRSLFRQSGPCGDLQEWAQGEANISGRRWPARRCI